MFRLIIPLLKVDEHCTYAKLQLIYAPYQFASSAYRPKRGPKNED